MPASKFPYKVTHLTHVSGCKTKFPPSGGRYVSSRPSLAAKKAVSQMCAHKTIRGQCALKVTLVRTDLPKHKRKEHTYLVHRKKLKKPTKVKIGDSMVTYKYELKAEKAKKSEKCTDKDYKQSRGPMKGGLEGDA
tara:strand:+ start:608 stop:1012 length:405 start_codon:yes stop_codon:yes gene_type:complete